MARSHERKYLSARPVPHLAEEAAMKFVKSVAEGNSAYARELFTDEAVLFVEKTLAAARVLEEGWGGRIDFTDALLLLKMDGQWKCAAKAYHQNSTTIAKE